MIRIIFTCFHNNEKHEYLSDKDFGEFAANNKGENVISYVINQGKFNDIEGYCDLIFDNNLLNSIEIIDFVP
jgi:hypothetical protein